MAMAKHVVRQTDCSAGQISETAARAGDKPLVRAAYRRMENFRPLGTGAAEARPGRRALFLQEGRSDEVRMSADATFKLCFGNGTLIVRDATDAVVKTQAGFPWTTATVDQIVWVRVKRQIAVWYPGMKPVLATWDGATTWTYADFAFFEDGQSKRYEPYYRFAAQGATMSVSALTGSGIDVVMSADVFEAGHVGVRFRFAGRQIEITAVTDAKNAVADVIEDLPPAYKLLGAFPDGFNIGDAIEGSLSNTKGVVIALHRDATPTDSYLVIQVTENFTGFVADSGNWSEVDRAAGTGGFNKNYAGDKIVGPAGVTGFNSQELLSPVSAALNTIWDEAVCSDVRGWPQSGFSDQDRLGMSDIPGVTNGVMWSAIDTFTDFLPGADPDSAMFETLNSPDRIYHVLGGADEFVFTDRGVKYIPISETNPLKPGSVAFREIPSPPSSSVRPISTPEGLVYVDAGRGRLVGIVGTGQITQPWLARDVSEYHSALFNEPIALAITTGSRDIPERYVYALNSDGTLALGRFDPAKEWVGWVPWSGPGSIKWVSGLDDRLLLTTLYSPNGVARYPVELLDPTAYLDALVPVNDVPTPLAPGIGQGPLWWLASSTVDLLDGRRYLGQRAVDASGNIVAEEGEDLSGAGIVAGLNAVATLQPFIHHAPEGQSAQQSMRRRKIGRISVAVQNSQGFTLDGRRIPPWVMGEDQSGQPPLREKAYFFRKLGRAVDPTVTLTKDVPGPLRVIEFGYEITV